jgi:hypothetical protein
MESEHNLCLNLKKPNQYPYGKKIKKIVWLVICETIGINKISGRHWDQDMFVLRRFTSWYFDKLLVMSIRY